MLGHQPDERLIRVERDLLEQQIDERTENDQSNGDEEDCEGGVLEETGAIWRSRVNRPDRIGRDVGHDATESHATIRRSNGHLKMDI
jgi:hypothetical protein